MARKPTEGVGTEGPFGVQRTSGLLRHTNEQTTAANATTEVAEAIDNPAFGRGGVHTGMEVERIIFMPSVGAPNYGGIGASGYFMTQIQVGDQSATPLHLDPDDEALFAHLHCISDLSTSGAGFGPVYPMVVPIVNVVPIIIEQYFTIMHEAQNLVQYNSKQLFTIVDYYTVEVPDSVYTQIMMSRRDQS